jgi:catechol 2,3-dioxygenase-like lactoylglutathione lyase family enzyme
MQIKLTNVMVNDQQGALDFYTRILGFIKKSDIPMDDYRWLTVVSKFSEEIELLLEPTAFEPAKTYQKALFDAGIPFASFFVTDLASEFLRLKELGVSFYSNPKAMGPVFVAIIDDTCGNLIQLVQQ